MYAVTVGYEIDRQGFVAVDSSLYKDKDSTFPFHTSPHLYCQMLPL